MPRPMKRFVSVMVDICFIIIAFWGAFDTRLDTLEGFVNDEVYWKLLAFLVIGTILIFAKSGLYRAILRYLSLHAIFSITISAVISSTFIGQDYYVLVDGTNYDDQEYVLTVSPDIA